MPSEFDEETSKPLLDIFLGKGNKITDHDIGGHTEEEKGIAQDLIDLLKQTFGFADKISHDRAIAPTIRHL